MTRRDYKIYEEMMRLVVDDNRKDAPAYKPEWGALVARNRFQVVWEEYDQNY